MDKRAVMLAEYEQILQQYVSGRVGCFFCSHPKCTYTSTKSFHVAEHVESRHIQGYTVSCLTCKEEFPTLASYGRHSCHVERSLRQYQVSSCTVPLFTLHCCTAGSPEPRGKQ